MDRSQWMPLQFGLYTVTDQVNRDVLFEQVFRQRQIGFVHPALVMESARNNYPGWRCIGKTHQIIFRSATIVLYAVRSMSFNTLRWLPRSVPTDPLEHFT